MLATGKIKRYQIVVTTIGCVVFPLSWIAFKFGFPPQTGYIIYFVVYCILVYVRLYLLKDMIKMPMSLYGKLVLVKVVPVMLISFLIPGILIYLMPSGLIRLLLVCVISVLTIITTEYFLGLTRKEQSFVLEKIKSVINKKIK